MECVHSAIREAGPWAYTGPVAVEPYTHENRAAHGNVGFTELCACGAERRYLVNGVHREYGVWGPSPEQARKRAAEAARHAKAEYLFRARAVALRHGVSLRVPASVQSPLQLYLESTVLEVELPDYRGERVPGGGIRTRRRVEATIRELRHAAADWRGLPGYAAEVYAAIAEALP